MGLIRLMGALVIFASVAAATGQSAPTTSLSIKVRSVAVRSEPKFWGAAVTTLKYGDTVSQLSGEIGWLKVKTKSGSIGYIHDSAVTTKKVILNANPGEVASLSDKSEIVLAGKGFNQEAEKQLKSSDTTLNFTAVDTIERVKISSSELGSFIRAGKLGKQG